MTERLRLIFKLEKVKLERRRLLSILDKLDKPEWTPANERQADDRLNAMTNKKVGR